MASPQQSPAIATAPHADRPLLRVRDLVVSFRGDQSRAVAVDRVSFDVFPNEVLGIVGESGSGKSVTSLALLRLIPDPPGKIEQGEIWLDDRDVLKLAPRALRQVRGREIAMIFQEPMTSLNPVFPIGTQVMEAIRVHEPRRPRREVVAAAVAMLDRVGIPDARARLRDYPHQFSGGMRQRVMIAMALVCNPRILIADEPTTALDVTTQAQILDLMLELKAQRAGASIMLITHDLAVVAETCQRVLVMYGGRIQEVGAVRDIFASPLHPYTRGLMASLPSKAEKGKRLYAIPGNVPAITEMPSGCKFCTRCEQVLPVCREREPELIAVGNQLVRCHLHEATRT